MLFSIFLFFGAAALTADPTGPSKPADPCSPLFARSLLDQMLADPELVSAEQLAMFNMTELDWMRFREYYEDDYIRAADLAIDSFRFIDGDGISRDTDQNDSN